MIINELKCAEVLKCNGDWDNLSQVRAIFVYFTNDPLNKDLILEPDGGEISLTTEYYPLDVRGSVIA